MITLKQLIPALTFIGVPSERVESAIAELKALLTELDEVEVKGRTKVDTLLGCMMALDAIIGEEAKDG